MRVLVTGGTGFIGRHAVEALLERGHEVTALVHRRSPFRPNPRLHCPTVDLLGPRSHVLRAVNEACAEALLMLAWETEHGKFWTAPSNALWCSSSLALARGFLDAGGTRIVCAGTCVEYQAPDAGPCVPDATPVRPIHPYAISKDCLHRMLRWMAAGEGASFAWGRIFLAYGPLEAPARLVPSVINAVLRGETAKCSSGRQKRDFMHAEDYGRAFALLTESDFDGALNVSSGQPRTIADVTTRLGELLGRSDLIELGALPDREGEPPNLWGEASCLYKATGFRPEYSLDERLRQTVEWWISRHQDTAIQL